MPNVKEFRLKFKPVRFTGLFSTYSAGLSKMLTNERSSGIFLSVTIFILIGLTFSRIIKRWNIIIST